MKHFVILFLLNSILLNGQITKFKEKFELPTEVQETSGLLFFNSKIITHNDSGDSASLYEIDSLTGNLLRTITITNATNVDWEDITEDETHIYVGDIGNNNGNRTDLKVYKINKTDFTNNDNISAEIISFSYEDQTDFTTRPNSHNFDAEAIIIYNNHILVFTKNWVNFETNVYKIPKEKGSYNAVKISNANVQGFITGADLMHNYIMLCGYDLNGFAFIIFINSDTESDDIFNNFYDKYILANELGAGNQVEGIVSFDETKFYISREAVSVGTINNTQALFEFTEPRATILSTIETNNNRVMVYPNPNSNYVFIKTKLEINNIELFTITGKKTIAKLQNDRIDISQLSKGIYFLKLELANQKNIVKKIIKK